MLVVAGAQRERPPCGDRRADLGQGRERHGVGIELDDVGLAGVVGDRGEALPGPPLRQVGVPELGRLAQFHPGKMPPQHGAVVATEAGIGDHHQPAGRHEAQQGLQRKQRGRHVAVLDHRQQQRPAAVERDRRGGADRAYRAPETITVHGGHQSFAVVHERTACAARRVSGASAAVCAATCGQSKAARARASACAPSAAA